MRVSDLTSGERLLIDRRRRAESMAEAALRLGVSRYRYRILERSKGARLVRPPAIGRVAPNERCLVLRTRSGMTVGELARQAGVSEWWVTQMERGAVSPDRLVAFWGARAVG